MLRAVHLAFPKRWLISYIHRPAPALPLSLGYIVQSKHRTYTLSVNISDEARERMFIAGMVGGQHLFHATEPKDGEVRVGIETRPTEDHLGKGHEG